MHTTTSTLYLSWWVGEKNILLSSRNKVLIRLSIKVTFRHLGEWSLWQLYLNMTVYKDREQWSVHNQAMYMKHCTCITSNTLHCDNFPPELTTLTALPATHFISLLWSTIEWRCFGWVGVALLEVRSTLFTTRACKHHTRSTFHDQSHTCLLWSEIMHWKSSKGILEMQIYSWRWEGSHNGAPYCCCSGI